MSMMIVHLDPNEKRNASDPITEHTSIDVALPQTQTGLREVDRQDVTTAFARGYDSTQYQRNLQSGDSYMNVVQTPNKATLR